MLDTLREEADGPPGLYDINDLAKVAEIGQTPQRTKIVECIRNQDSSQVLVFFRRWE